MIPMLRYVYFYMFLLLHKSRWVLGGGSLSLTAFAGNRNGIKTRSFVYSSKGKGKGNGTGIDKDGDDNKPKLVLIGGAPGTGKSTFGMSVALDQGILKCISTDTVRAVMRSFIPKDISPALHRSSYAKAFEHEDDPVHSWKETCAVLETSLMGLVTDSITRNQGLVLEGVSLVPSKKLIDMWERGGGVATGCLLTVTKEETHKALLERRGMIAGRTSEQNAKDQRKIQSFDRIRKVQDEMVSLAKESGWILIEQKVEEVDPLDIIASQLSDEDCNIPESLFNNNKKEEHHVEEKKVDLSSS